MAGVYIHIPFCKKACHYCNFHFSTKKNYTVLVNAILKEIEINQKKFNNKNISTIYFGGGTPSIIENRHIQKIITKVKNQYNVFKNCEITLEVNPDDVNREKLKKWNKIGINRLSLGAQTFDTATAQQYMNPYTNNVIQSTISDLGEAFAQQQRGLAARAVGAGAFGGSREGVERVLGQERFLDQVADTSSRLRQAGFESGAQRFAADRAAQLGAAQAQLSGLAGAAQGLGQAGSLARGIEQAGLTEAYRDFIEEREYPAGQVRQMIGALAGAPIRTYGEERTAMTGTPVGAPSPFAQIVGAGQAFAAMSDIRLKEDIKLIGKSPSGINIYNFKYKGDNTTYQGVMAHQVPKASTPNEFGYLMVDYSKIDVEFKKVN